jgi:hypothetical protein
LAGAANNGELSLDRSEVGYDGPGYAREAECENEAIHAARS